MKDFVTYGLIGDPVGHSMSPTVFNTFLQYYEQNAAFIAIKIKKGELKKLIYDYSDSLMLGGFTVTMPHKEDILPYLDELSEEARLCRAVNVVSVRDGKRYGHTTDGLGCLLSFEAGGKKAKDQKAVIYGAGGASKSIAQAFSAKGADVTVISRNPEKAKESLSALKGVKVGDSKNLLEQIRDCTLFVNASPLGMKGSPNFESFSFLDLLSSKATVF